jgi:hypothetical protein
MNVRSLKTILLWGLDFLTPSYGLFKDRLDTEVEHVPRYSTKQDVKRNFLPILTFLVRGARTTHFTKSDIQQTARALVNLNAYFSELIFFMKIDFLLFLLIVCLSTIGIFIKGLLLIIL